MSAVATSVDQATDIMQKLSVETKNNGSDAPVMAKKPSGIQYGPANAGQPPKFQMTSLERSSTPVIPGYMDPNVYFIPNGYPSTGFYIGGYDGFTGEWDDYSGYLNSEGVEMPHGVYGDIYHHGYGFAPYGAYPCSVSPVPSLEHDNIIYGSQHYQYPPPYFQSQAPPNGLYSSNHFPASQAEPAELPPLVAVGQPSVNIGSGRSNSNVIVNGNSGYLQQRHSQQSSLFPSNDSYSGGALSSGQHFSGYQDPSLSFDGMRSPITCYYGPASTNPYLNSATPNTVSSTASHNVSSISTRNQNVLNSPRTVPTMNRIYPTSLLHGQNGTAVRDGAGFGSKVFDSQMNFYGNYGYGYENFDGLSELSRGPRANRFKIRNGPVPTNEIVEEPCIIPNREQYNRADFPESYNDAKFFIIKSYSEDDIHRSIKYGVWTSTPSGNKKLDAAYKEAMEKPDGCPVFLFFSVNTSGQFVGVAEMVGPVDFNKTVNYWQQDKWIGCFNVKWHIFKDVPNHILRHITLEYNDNKPVTNSRDTQEVKLEQGLQMLKIFKDHVSNASILDDFRFYDSRQKMMLERKAWQQQHNKQVVAVKITKPVGEKDKETANSNTRLQKPLESAPVLKNSAIPEATGEPSDENCLPRVTVDIPTATKPANEKSESANGV
ncbi:YTH domain-containing protein ECT4 [Dendrobium catenatum]|uniref:YTH domain-containing family protein n=1 Tax=Dendrobium catenatum TaxID=906689 RepID=A0A2I0V6S8_9ASPA|nr:YTH domain-containing protein ECT4 [Dendrobium catenatum]PKU59106.1 Cleavage and polyadenylation specificity factor CPSF30 [Dendrobium catenatum]